MSETNQKSSLEFTPDIRIVRLNTEKTRRIIGSFTGYQVYFELSETAPPAWRDIFAREWSDLNPLQEAGIDGRFLVMHCPLQKIAVHLPVMKKAVAATNEAYKQYAQGQATEQKRREDVWKDERKTVEDIAKSLRFE
jgi:hypothetical protein